MYVVIRDFPDLLVVVLPKVPSSIMFSSFHSVSLIPAEFLTRDLAEIAEHPTSSPPLSSRAAGISQKPQRRCGACTHKLLLSDLTCKCGTRFCSKHRLPEDHECSFDHRAHDKTVLEAAITACVSDKMGDRC